MKLKKILAITLCAMSVSSISFAEDIVYDAEGKIVDEELVQNDLVGRFYCDGDYSKCIVNAKDDGTYNITNTEREITYNVTKDCVEVIDINYNFATSPIQNYNEIKPQEAHKEQIENVGYEIQAKHQSVDIYVQKAIAHNKDKYPNLSNSWQTMTAEQKAKVARDYIAIAGLSLKPSQLPEVKDQFANFSAKEISELETSLSDLILRYKLGMNKQSCLLNQ